jgi:hypothetical protein
MAGYIDFTIDNGHYEVGGLVKRVNARQVMPKMRLLLVGRRALGYTFLKGQKLFRTERLIVDLSSRLNQILQVCPSDIG